MQFEFMVLVGELMQTILANEREKKMHYDAILKYNYS